MMKSIKAYTTTLGLVLAVCIKFLPAPAQAASFLPEWHQQPASAVEVCFTPGGPCTDVITSTLAKAQRQILVQAYQLSAEPIAQALFAAKARGVEVDVILDKSQLHQRYAMTCQLLSHGIPVLIDKKPAIAHNKVMVIDEHETITGSFNFTDNAQYHNAENLLVINDKALAQQYIANWRRRATQSITLNPEQIGQLACQHSPLPKHNSNSTIG